MTNEITRIGSTRPGPGGPQNAFGPRDQDTDSRTHPRDQDVTRADQSESTTRLQVQLTRTEVKAHVLM